MHNSAKFAIKAEKVIQAFFDDLGPTVRTKIQWSRFVSRPDAATLTVSFIPSDLHPRFASLREVINAERLMPKMKTDQSDYFALCAGAIGAELNTRKLKGRVIDAKFPVDYATDRKFCVLTLDNGAIDYQIVSLKEMQTINRSSLSPAALFSASQYEGKHSVYSLETANMLRRVVYDLIDKHRNDCVVYAYNDHNGRFTFLIRDKYFNAKNGNIFYHAEINNIIAWLSFCDHHINDIRPCMPYIFEGNLNELNFNGYSILNGKHIIYYNTISSGTTTKTISAASPKTLIKSPLLFTYFEDKSAKIHNEYMIDAANVMLEQQFKQKHLSLKEYLILNSTY